MQNILETKNLSKRFGPFTAVDDISINVRKGEIYGFLGLNGAGKTTTIRMLLGMIRPTAGACFLGASRVNTDTTALWNRVGYLVEIPYSYPELTVRENLEIVRRLRFLPDRRAIDVVMEKLNLRQYENRPARNLSLGNAQRLGLAKAMIHNPEILILDEPANGLDPAGIVEIRELLLSLARDHGVTVFISSHILGEVSKFATRIGIIHKGRMLQEATTDELVGLRKRRLLVGVADADGARAVLARQGIAAKMAEGGLLETTDAGALDAPEKINGLLVGAGRPPSMLKIDEEDLESYFLRVVESGGGVR
jgi:ABC-2 type transport system ATP-binding protein